MTHAHLDHAGGAGFLLADCPNATVHTHERAAPHLSDPTQLIEGTRAAVGEQWQYYVEPNPAPASRINALTDGDTVHLGDRSLTAVAAPGHALHQMMFYDTTEDTLFTGDAAGIYIPMQDRIQQTSPPSQFNLETCLDDVRAIDSMAPETLCFGHFGPRVYDDELLSSYKRALVEWVEAVRQKRVSYCHLMSHCLTQESYLAKREGAKPPSSSSNRRERVRRGYSAHTRHNYAGSYA